MAKPVAPIELRHLRYFVAASEHDSFRKAGAALGIQESAISRRVRDLEDRIGATLFHRHSGGVSLTFAGQRLLSSARQIIRQVDQCSRDIAAIGRSDGGCVRIGVFSSIASGFLAELLCAYQRRHANVQIGLVDGEPAEQIAAVRQLRLDVTFVTGMRDWPGCDTIQLWSERVFAVLPEAHALTGKEELEWHDLAQETFIVSEAAPGREVHDYLVQHLAGLGHHPQIGVQNVRRDNLLPLVALGRGLTLTSEAATAAQLPGIVYRPIAGELLPFSAVWSPKNGNPAFRRLLSLAKVLARRS